MSKKVLDKGNMLLHLLIPAPGRKHPKPVVLTLLCMSTRPPGLQEPPLCSGPPTPLSHRQANTRQGLGRDTAAQTAGILTSPSPLATFQRCYVFLRLCDLGACVPTLCNTCPLPLVVNSSATLEKSLSKVGLSPFISRASLQPLITEDGQGADSRARQAWLWSPGVAPAQRA